MDKLRVPGLYHCFRPINENWYRSQRKTPTVCVCRSLSPESSDAHTTVCEFASAVNFSSNSLSDCAGRVLQQFMSLSRRLSESGRVRFFKNKLHSVRRARAGWLIGHWSTSVAAGGDATATAVGEDTTGKLRHLSLSSWTSGLESTDQYYRQTDNARSLSRCKCGLSNGENGVSSQRQRVTRAKRARLAISFLAPNCSQPAHLHPRRCLPAAGGEWESEIVISPRQPTPWAANEKLPRDKHLRMKRLRNNCLLSSRTRRSIAARPRQSTQVLTQPRLHTHEPNQHTPPIACVLRDAGLGIIDGVTFYFKINCFQKF